MNGNSPHPVQLIHAITEEQVEQEARRRQTLKEERALRTARMTSIVRASLSRIPQPPEQLPPR